MLVDLSAPDFNPPDRVQAMLESVAAAVARQAGVDATEVFVTHQAARSGQVFDEGAVARW